MDPSPQLWVCAFTTATLWPELIVSMGPSAHLWYFHSKQRLHHENCKSLWIPALICGFCIQNCDFWIRMTSLYVSQASPDDLWMHKSVQNSDFWIRITSLYGSQTSPVDLWMQNSVLRARMTLVYCSQPSSVVLCIQTSAFSIRITSLYGSQPSFVAFAC